MNEVCSSCIIFSMKDNWRHSYVTRTFWTCNVLKESGFIQEMNYSIKLSTFLPSIFMTGVHPPSPQPKFPMWQKTDNGWESTRRVTTPLTLDLLNENEKKKKKRKNTTSNEKNDGEIKLKVLKIIIIATTVAMIMEKILIDNNNYNNNSNDSTNKQMESWSFRRQYQRNINNGLHKNNARLFVMESNRCPS